MKNKKILFLAAAMLLGAGSLASCGNGNEGGNSIKVWAAKDDQAFLGQVVEKFKAAYPDYANANIELGITEEPDVPAALKTDLAASADVFHFAGDQLGELVASNYLYGIPSALTSNIGIEPAVLEAGKVGGNQYGIPFTPNTYFMYYDASVYTAEDIKSLETMMAKDVGDYTYNFGFDVANGWYLQSYFFSAGCTIFGESGEDATKGIEPADKGLEVAKWMWDVYNGPDKDKYYRGPADAQCGISVAACVTGTWSAATIAKNMTDNGGTYACAPLPKLTIGGHEYEWKSVGDYKHIGVNAVTEAPELAATFAAYLANAESQALRYTLRGTAPTNAETASDDTIEWDASIVAQTEQLNHTFKQPTIYGQQNFWDAATGFGSDLSIAKNYEVVDYFDNFNNLITAA